MINCTNGSPIRVGHCFLGATQETGPYGIGLPLPLGELAAKQTERAITDG